ncbi:hypothetical protein J3Q64DRAFT_1823930 [Phycomyces blakesleeanus]|uniref:G-protein coupled receptors family 1 profile domain-containing protein n=1 Tax=Phycomyces blakesleeanus TaxID=4837 RepID=A0ABR3AS47_PHYBL
MSLIEPNQTIFWLLCDKDNVCYCDWRLYLKDCVLQDELRHILLGGAIVSTIVAVVAILILFYRVHCKGQSVWEYSPTTNFIRPKPIDSFLLMLGLYNGLRAIQTYIVLGDVLQNVIFRSFFHELPWQFAVASMTCYFFGIIHTIAENHKTLSIRWIRRPVLIDRICTVLIICPFITNNIFSICSGVYAQNGNLKMAYIFSRVLHITWGAYCGFALLIIFLSGKRLVRLLQEHRKMRIKNNSDIGAINVGIIKVRVVALAASAALVMFTFLSFSYGAARNEIMMRKGLSLTICVFWMFNAPVAYSVCEVAIILTPKLTTALGFSDHSTHEEEDDIARPSSKIFNHIRSSSLPQNQVRFPKRTLSKIDTQQKNGNGNGNEIDYVFSKDVTNSDTINNGYGLNKEGLGVGAGHYSANTSPVRYEFNKVSSEHPADFNGFVTALDAPRHHTSREKNREFSTKATDTIPLQQISSSDDGFPPARSNVKELSIKDYL